MYERTQRRLAAIVAADVVGCSRLKGAGEAGTAAAHWAHRGELIDPQIAAHDGHLVKAMGDGPLLRFFSVIAAVECALETQERLLEWCSAFAQCMRRTRPCAVSSAFI
jgi:adenylate cyclase